MTKTVSNYNFEQKRKRLKRINRNKKNIKSIIIANKQVGNHWPIAMLKSYVIECQNRA